MSAEYVATPDQIEAAKLRVLLDRRLGRETDEVILQIAETGTYQIDESQVEHDVDEFAVVDDRVGPRALRLARQRIRSLGGFVRRTGEPDVDDSAASKLSETDTFIRDFVRRVENSPPNQVDMMISEVARRQKSLARRAEEADSEDARARFSDDAALFQAAVTWAQARVFGASASQLFALRKPLFRDEQ